MSYTMVNWVDSPDTSTPLSAENLNKMDAGIEQNAEDIALLNTLGTESFQSLYVTNVDMDTMFANAPFNSVCLFRNSSSLSEPFDSNNYFGLQWKNGSGAYGTQIVFGFSTTNASPAVRSRAAGVWSDWKSL